MKILEDLMIKDLENQCFPLPPTFDMKPIRYIKHPQNTSIIKRIYQFIKYNILGYDVKLSEDNFELVEIDINKRTK